MSYYKGKKILVIGGTGLIGMPLVHKLLEREAKLTVVSLDENIDLDKSIEFKKLDLRDFNNCLKVTKNKDIVFNLAGIKGSPKMTKEKPASFFVPTLTFSVNIMEAARRNDVKNFLFTRIDYKKNRPQFKVNIDRNKASDLRVSSVVMIFHLLFCPQHCLA